MNLRANLDYCIMREGPAVVGEAFVVLPVLVRAMDVERMEILASARLIFKTFLFRQALSKGLSGWVGLVAI